MGCLSGSSLMHHSVKTGVFLACFLPVAERIFGKAEGTTDLR